MILTLACPYRAVSTLLGLASRRSADLVRHGGLRPIVALALDWNHDVSRGCLLALQHLSMVPSNIDQMIAAGAVQVMIPVAIPSEHDLRRRDDATKVCVADVIANMTLVPTVHGRLVVRASAA